MSHEEYQAIDAVNFSTLKEMRRSAAHYFHALSHRRGDTDALRLGRATHTAVLEPDKFATEYAIWPAENGRRFGKKWDAFAVENGEESILTEAEFSQCVALQQAVRANPVAAKYLTGGMAEQTVEWTDSATGIKCKCRTDYLAPHWIVDLKTCRNASPVDFGRECYRYLYHAQAAFYSEGVAANRQGEVPQFVIIAVEKFPPYVVQVYHLPAVTVDEGSALIREWMATLQECRKADRWPAYTDGEVELLLPDWAVDNHEDNDLSELGLEVA